eukprot:252127_1
MSAGFANSHSLSRNESTSSISNLSGAAIHLPQQSLVDPTTQNLISTAQRYQQTNKQNLLKKLQTSVKSRRHKIFFGLICIITFVLCYQWILYLMSDLHQNYSYNKPLFIQYISYTLFPILIGIPLIKPLWIISNKHHKSLINKQNTVISQYNSKYSNYTSTPYVYKHKNDSTTLALGFGFMTSQNDNRSTKSGTTDNTENEKKLSVAHSDINSTNSYEYDDQYDEFGNDSLLSGSAPPPQTNTKQHEDSVTELGMISELSFNHIHDTHDAHGNQNTQTSVYADSYDENNFSHSKQSGGTFTNKNGLLQPYFSNKDRDSVTSMTQGSRHNSGLKIPDHTKQNSALIYRQAKSECGPLLDEDDERLMNLEIKHEIHKSRNSNLFKSNIKKTKDKKIIVTSGRDVSHIPQSVHFELNLPDRTFAFFGKNIGFKAFLIMFFINVFASVSWLKSIGNGLEEHGEEFFIENSIHCGRVIIAYFLSVICLTNMSSIVNYKSLNLMNCQNLFCLCMLIVGLVAILLNNYHVFTEQYNIIELATLFVSPVFNGILLMYLQYISMQYLYKKNFYMFLGDVFFVIGIMGIINLIIMTFVLLLSDFTDIEIFEFPSEWEIIWRLLLIAFLWWLYNICVFIGVMMLNSIVIGFGFCLIIPCNIIFDTTVNVVNVQTDKEIFMLIGICLIGLSFIIYEMQFYIWYVMYCGDCRNCCIQCRTSCVRWIHKKTQYRLYGKFQCCCKYRCCCL